ncbi:MAG: ubiquinone biosynthesis protein [Polyangiales bacterium]|jgi:ubiquinone biosynthesis protein
MESAPTSPKRTSSSSVSVANKGRARSLIGGRLPRSCRCSAFAGSASTRSRTASREGSRRTISFASAAARATNPSAEYRHLEEVEFIVEAEGIFKLIGVQSSIESLSLGGDQIGGHGRTIANGPLGATVLWRYAPQTPVLAIRFIRASWLFGSIFAAYSWHFLLAKIFRLWKEDVEGRLIPHDAPWIRSRKERIDAHQAKRLLHGILELRGVYIKMGQVLSIMGGFLPAAYAKELESLQDAVPPRPFDEFLPLFRDTLHAEPDDLFESFERTPVAAASLGQVHVAHGRGGEKYAVKMIYPGIRQEIRVDMRVVGLSMRVYKRFVPVQGIERVHEALVDLLRRETDYVHEAECMGRMAANFEGREGVAFPEVIESLSGKDVLTMTFMEGEKITRFERYEALGLERRKVATRLVESFYEQLFVHRFFHADPHPGNFLVREGNELVILDFGAICEVEEKMILGLLDVLRGFFEGRDDLVLSGIEDIGFLAPDGDRALLEQTVKTYFRKLLKVERTPGALMRATQQELEELADPEMERRELRELMKSVNYPAGWFYVERASILMFWLVGQIDPELDTLQIGMPYLLPLMAKRIAEDAAPKSAAFSSATM